MERANGCGCVEDGRPGCNYEWETFINRSNCIVPKLIADRNAVVEKIRAEITRLDCYDEGQAAERASYVIEGLKFALAALGQGVSDDER